MKIKANTPGMNALTANSIQGSGDAATAAKQVETVFLNEFLKIIMEQTSFGKDKTVSNYMPMVTEEIAKSLAERGVGVGAMLMNNPHLNIKKGPDDKGGGVPDAAGGEAATAITRQLHVKDRAGKAKGNAAKALPGYGKGLEAPDG